MSRDYSESIVLGWSQDIEYDLFPLTDFGAAGNANVDASVKPGHLLEFFTSGSVNGVRRLRTANVNYTGLIALPFDYGGATATTGPVDFASAIGIDEDGTYIAPTASSGVGSVQVKVGYIQSGKLYQVRVGSADQISFGDELSSVSVRTTAGQYTSGCVAEAGSANTSVIFLSQGSIHQTNAYDQELLTAVSV